MFFKPLIVMATSSIFVLAGPASAALIDFEFGPADIGSTKPLFIDDQVLADNGETVFGNPFAYAGVRFETAVSNSTGSAIGLIAEDVGGTRAELDTNTLGNGFGFINDAASTILNGGVPTDPTNNGLDFADILSTASGATTMGGYFARMGPEFFLGNFERGDGIGGNPGEAFLRMEYLSDAVVDGNSISFTLYDIDGSAILGTEGFRVKFLDASDAVLLTSGEVEASDGTIEDIAFEFALNFDGSGNVLGDTSATHNRSEIRAMEIFFTGTKTITLGIGLDNFETGATGGNNPGLSPIIASPGFANNHAPIPVPAPLAMLGAVVIAGFAYMRRKAA